MIEHSLGAFFSKLQGRTLVYLLRFLSARDLCAFGSASKGCYLYANDESLWKDLCLAQFGPDFNFSISWKFTTITHTFPKRATTQPKYPLQVSGLYSEYLYKKWYRSYISLEYLVGRDCGEILKIDANELTPERFFREFDATRRPVIIKNALTSWPAFSGWQIDCLVEKYGDVSFKTDVGDPKNPRKALQMKLRNYIQYCLHHHDEDPLYIFDQSFHKRAPQLLDEFRVPPYFATDFLELLKDKRPRFRWLVIGPPRSGSAFHIDPYSTSAWNALLVGRKRWLLYPPDIVPPGVTAWFDAYSGRPQWDSPRPITWLLEHYPYVMQQSAEKGGGTRLPQPLEVIQEPGDLIFVPFGWWHFVLNLDLTVAVTQNYCNEVNLKAVFGDFMRARQTERMKLLKEGLAAENRPDLVAVLEEVEKDSWTAGLPAWQRAQG